VINAGEVGSTAEGLTKTARLLETSAEPINIWACMLEEQQNTVLTRRLLRGRDLQGEGRIRDELTREMSYERSHYLVCQQLFTLISTLSPCFERLDITRSSLVCLRLDTDRFWLTMGDATLEFARERPTLMGVVLRGLRVLGNRAHAGARCAVNRLCGRLLPLLGRAIGALWVWRLAALCHGRLRLTIVAILLLNTNGYKAGCASILLLHRWVVAGRSIRVGWIAVLLVCGWGWSDAASGGCNIARIVLLATHEEEHTKANQSKTDKGTNDSTCDPGFAFFLSGVIIWQWERRCRAR